MLANGQPGKQRPSLGHERQSPAGQEVGGHAPDVLAGKLDLPEIGRLSPAIVSRVVVLPAPLGPSSATTSPGRTSG